MRRRTLRADSSSSPDLRDPRHSRRVGAALFASLVFTLFTLATKEIPAVYAHLPWAEDPTDTVVSFAVFFVPICGLVAGVRFAMCRGGEPPPDARVAGVLGAASVAVWTALITLAAEWAGLLVGARSAAPDSIALVAVAGLALATAVVVVGAIGLAAVPWPADDAGLPDGLADALAAGRALAARLGVAGRPLNAMLGLAELRAAPLVRRRPVRSAAVASVAFGTALAVTGLREVGISPLGALIGIVGTCGMFAFVVGSGPWLRLVAPGPEPARRRRLVDAAVVGAAAVPCALAFRNAMWAVIPVGSALGPGSLLALVASAGISAFALTLALDRSRSSG